MNNSRIKNIVNLSAAERYGYFIRKVSDFEEVWGLKDKEGWALMGNNEQVLFPVWSEKEFAELCKWDNYQPNSIRKHSASCVFFSPLFLPTFVASL